MENKMKRVLYMAFLLIVAVLLGGLIGNAVQGASALSWLGYYKTFAFEPGTFLDLDVLRLSFGIRFSANIAQVVLIAIGIIVFYKTAPKLISGK